MDHIAVVKDIDFVFGVVLTVLPTNMLAENWVEEERVVMVVCSVNLPEENFLKGFVRLYVDRATLTGFEIGCP